MAGLTSNGFIIPSVQELLSEMKADLDLLSGRDISIAPDTPIGVQLTVVASQLEKLWASAQGVYDSKNKLKAEGTSLDDLAAWLNISRFKETNSAGYVTFLGTKGTTIPQGTQVQDPNSTLVCTTNSTTTLDNASCNGVFISLVSLVVGISYIVTINTLQYIYTVVAGDTTATVLNNLANIITHPSTIVSVIDNKIKIIGSTPISSFSISVNPNLVIDMVYTSVLSTLTTSGDVYIPANSMTKLVTGISGIDSVSNREDFNTGQAEESDESLRLRISKEVAKGKATPDAIISNLKSRVAGITEVILVQNLNGTPDGSGRPSHSFETYVVGGLSQDIADVLWDVSPAGIQTWGTNTVAVTDINGDTQYVKFSRLSAVNLFIRVTYSTYNEESLTPNVVDVIKDIVVDEVNSSGSGVDFIPQRLFGPIFSGTTGIQTLNIEWSDNGITWSNTTKPISQFEVARTTLSNVNVTAAP